MLIAKIETGKGAVGALRIIGARTYAAASASAQPQRLPPTERPYLPAPVGLKVSPLFLFWV